MCLRLEQIHMVLKSFFKNKSIRFKLLCIYISIILLAIIILSTLSTRMFSKTVESQSNQQTIQMIDQVTNNVEFYIHDMENIIFYLSKDEDVLSFMGSSISENSHTLPKIKRLIKTYTDSHPEIAGMVIVNEANQYLCHNMYRIARDPLTTEIWYQQAIQDPLTIHLFSKPIGRNITYYDKNFSADDVVSITKAIYDPKTNQYCGVILIDIKLEFIEKLISHIVLGKTGFIFIMDNNGDIVYTPINNIVYRIRPEWFKNRLSASSIKKIQNSIYQIMYSTSGYTGWHIIGVFSLNEALQVIFTLRNYSILITLIILFFAIIAAAFFTDSLTKPLGKLKQLMKRAEEGSLDVQFHTTYNDEIGQLGQSFNHMIDAIKNLINLVNIEHKRKRNAELQAFQAQIKPHFLYNTLDTIHWMALDYNARDIIEIVDALTNLFRIGLSRGSEIISLADEIEHVKSYLIIQMARYEDKFHYSFTYEEELLGYKVIKLIIQPIVENAIYHGVKAQRGKGQIQIKIEEKNQALLISVTDTGPGIPSNKVKEMNEILEGFRIRTQEYGYGLFNVNERIKLTYGNIYGITLYSTLGKGTTVIIRHPIQRI